MTDDTSARGQFVIKDVVLPQDDAVVVRDSTTNTIEDQARELAALRAQVAALTKKEDNFSAPQGGPAVAHHLHLTDGRVIPNHGGIGTHYSEVLDDGSTRITRIVSYYPVDEIPLSGLSAQ